MAATATSFTELFGVELDVVQAPMAGAQGSRVALAVCNAGGLGSIPCAMLSHDALRDELTAMTTGTSNPYNVNFFVHPRPKVDAEVEDRWRTALAPFYEEFGLDPQNAPTVRARRPFDHDVADIVEEFRPPIVSFHFGLPDEALMTRVRSWGSTILSSATTVDEALWLETRGADVVIAQGVEAGGHRAMFLSDDLTTQVGTFALVPQVAARVNVPSSPPAESPMRMVSPQRSGSARQARRSAPHSCCARRSRSAPCIELRYAATLRVTPR